MNVINLTLKAMADRLYTLGRICQFRMINVRGMPIADKLHYLQSILCRVLFYLSIHPIL